MKQKHSEIPEVQENISASYCIFHFNNKLVNGIKNKKHWPKFNKD